VNVPIIPSIRILSPSNNQIFDTPNASITFDVTDFSIGAGQGEIHVQLDGGPEWKWSSLQPIILTNLTNGRHNLTLVLSDAGGNHRPNPEARAAVSFIVQLPVPPGLPDMDVSVSKILMSPAQPRSGDLIQFEAKIANIGDGTAGAFKLRFLIDGKLLEEQTVSRLQIGESITQKTQWRAVAGNHNLTVLVDPMNAITEKSERNNNATYNYNVESIDVPSQDNLWMYAGIGTGVILLVAIVVVLIIIKKKKQSP